MRCKRLHNTKTSPKSAAGRMIRRSAAAVLLPLTTLLVLMPVTSGAQQWLVTPEIEIAAQHVENPRLEEEEETKSITGGLVDMGLALQRNSPTSSFVLRPAVTVYRYPDDPDEDSEAYFLDFDAGREGQRSSWRIRGNYHQQQVFHGETTTSDVDDFIEDDVQTGTGRTFDRRQRDLWRVAPGLTVEFTELTSLEVDLTYLDVSYDQQELGEAVDYRDMRIDTALVRALSQYNRIEFAVFASRYDPVSLPRETDRAGARVGYRQSTSDISTFFVEVGAQEAQAQSALDPELEISETSFLWNVGYEHQLEVTRWRFDLGQDVTPSGSGLLERDLYRAVMEHQLQPRWSVQLAALFMNTGRIAGQDAVSLSERDYLQGSATLAYQITPSWTVQGLYTLTHQDFADTPGDGQKHEFRLSFVYQPPLPTATE